MAQLKANSTVGGKQIATVQDMQNAGGGGVVGFDRPVFHGKISDDTIWWMEDRRQVDLTVYPILDSNEGWDPVMSCYKVPKPGIYRIMANINAYNLRDNTRFEIGVKLADSSNVGFTHDERFTNVAVNSQVRDSQWYAGWSNNKIDFQFPFGVGHSENLYDRVQFIIEPQPGYYGLSGSTSSFVGIGGPTPVRESTVSIYYVGPLIEGHY